MGCATHADDSRCRSKAPVCGIVLIAAILASLFPRANRLIGPAYGAAPQTPMAVVQSVLNQATSILQAPGLSVEKRREALRDLAQAHLDFDNMARSALGDHWRDLSDSQRRQYVRLFTAFIEDAYLNKIQGFVRLTFQYVRETMDGPARAEVQTLVLQTDEEPIRLDFELEREGPGWKVYDVSIDSVSMVSNYRGQFNRVIDNQGFDALMNILQAKQKELASLLGREQGSN